MYTEQPASSTTPSTSSSSPAQSPEPDPSPPQSPLSVQSEPLPPASPPLTSDILSDPPLREARHYVPHVVGLGVTSPHLNIGSLSPLHRESSAPSSQAQARSSPPVQRHNPFEPASQQAGSGLYGSPQYRSANPFDELEGLPPPSPSLAYVEASAANAMLSPEPTSPGAQRPDSPDANAIGLRISVPPPHHPGNPFVHGVLSPPPDIPASTSTPQAEYSPSPPAQGSTSTLDLSEEMPSNANDAPMNLDFAEFDSEGLNTLEKIYLFSRSRASFQRVFIAHALPSYLRSAFRNSTHVKSSDHANESEEDMDVITPAEAVEYVLPLLNGLAMDEGTRL